MWWFSVVEKAIVAEAERLVSQGRNQPYPMWFKRDDETETLTVCDGIAVFDIMLERGGLVAKLLGTPSGFMAEIVRSAIEQCDSPKLWVDTGGVAMTLTIEDDGRWLTMTKGFRVICRTPSTATDWGMEESLSAFVGRHGGIDATLDYLRKCSRQGS